EVVSAAALGAEAAGASRAALAGASDLLAALGAEPLVLGHLRVGEHGLARIAVLDLRDLDQAEAEAAASGGARAVGGSGAGGGGTRGDRRTAGSAGGGPAGAGATGDRGAAGRTSARRCGVRVRCAVWRAGGARAGVGAADWINGRCRRGLPGSRGHAAGIAVPVLDQAVAAGTAAEQRTGPGGHSRWHRARSPSAHACDRGRSSSGDRW